MINREDMLALTRRMTVKRTSMTRIAGGYLDRDGYIDGTFNTGFLKLSPDEKEKNLQIAKFIPFADTNKNLKEYAFSDEKMKGDSMRKLLMGMRACGLKNDALMETFYEIVGERYQSEGDYAIFVFHDRYDIPAKGKDHVRQGESNKWKKLSAMFAGIFDGMFHRPSRREKYACLMPSSILKKS